MRFTKWRILGLVGVAAATVVVVTTVLPKSRLRARQEPEAAPEASVILNNGAVIPPADAVLVDPPPDGNPMGGNAALGGRRPDPPPSTVSSHHVAAMHAEPDAVKRGLVNVGMEVEIWSRVPNMAYQWEVRLYPYDRGADTPAIDSKVFPEMQRIPMRRWTSLTLLKPVAVKPGRYSIEGRLYRFPANFDRSKLSDPKRSRTI
jgi:hypothetical protein